MRSYTIYHFRDGVAPSRHPGEQTPRRVKPGDYQRVAEVMASDLEEAFEQTNTVEAPWWKRSAVNALSAQPPLRSTSVGDLIASGNSLWMVEGCGFRQVSWEPDGTRKRRS